MVGPISPETVMQLLPETVGESGSVAAKETEPMGYTVKFDTASGFGAARAGRGTAPSMPDGRPARPITRRR